MLWEVKNIDTDNVAFKNFFYEKNVSGFSKNKFFNPSLELLNSESKLKNINQALDRIHEALVKNEKILVYGDYDVDGTTATSILLKTFFYLDKKGLMNYSNVSYYIPRRKNEGYGLNKQAIDKIKSQNVNLIITVDLGISEKENVDYINEKNIDVIITDHHKIGEEIPNCKSVINPHMKDENGDYFYPFPNMCGGLVSYKLAIGILKNEIKDFNKILREDENLVNLIKELLLLSSLATIADIMPLNDENRVVVKYGLKYLREGRNLGINSLLEILNINRETITEREIGFIISPRINSAGRLDTAEIAVELFMENNPKKAKVIANKLNELNSKRQSIVEKIFQNVKNEIEEKETKEEIIISIGNYDIGVIGIVASRIVDTYSKPAIIISNESKDILIGSTRSLGNFNIYNALTSVRELLERFGGHNKAAGFSIREENLEEFKQGILKYTEDFIKENKKIEKIEKVDQIIHESKISLDTLKKLNMYGPFGEGNSNFKFVLTDVNFLNPDFIGAKKNHFKAKTYKNKLDIIKFNAYDDYENIDFSKEFDILFQMEENNFMGKTNIQLKLIDLKSSLNYENDYEDIYKIACKRFNEFCKLGEKEEVSIISKDKVKKIDLEEIYNLEDTIFIVYSEKSFKYLKKIFYYRNKEIYFYNEDNLKKGKNYILLFPTKISLKEIKDDYKIVIVDNTNLYDDIFNLKNEKYILNEDQFKVNNFKKPEDIRKNMVTLYKIYERNTVPLKISSILNKEDMSIYTFFLTNEILKNLDLIDIDYNFKYNNVITKILKVEDKKNLLEFTFYKNIKKYCSMYNI